MRIRHHLGFGALGLATSFSLGCSALLPTSHVIASQGMRVGVLQARAAAGLHAQSVGGSTSYMVAFTGGIPAGFDAAVKAAAGTVVAEDATLGVAVASSANPNFASQISALAGVQAVSVTKSKFRLANTYIAAAGGHEHGSTGNGSNLPNAPFFLGGMQWDMTDVHADQVWPVQTGSHRIKVAVLDTGVDYNNPNLAPNYDAADSVSFVQTVIDPSTGAPLAGTNFFGQPIQDDGPDPMDYLGHGSHVAGIIAAAQNGTGISGVAPGVQIMDVKVLDATGYGDDFGIMKGIVWAVDHGADVINMSIEEVGPSNDPTIQAESIGYTRAIDYATEHGVFVASAAGNFAMDADGSGATFLPAQQGRFNVAVSSVGPQNGANPDTFSLFSDYGNSLVDLAAPGGNIIGFSMNPDGTPAIIANPYTDFVFSTWSMNGLGYPILGMSFPASPYMFLAGTSMATPHVAGAAALVLSRHRMAPAALDRLLERTADKVWGGTGTNPYYGHGRLNVYRAYTAVDHDDFDEHAQHD